MQDFTRTEANADVKGGNQINGIKSLVINSKMFFNALKDIKDIKDINDINDTGIKTKADIEKKIIEYTTNSEENAKASTRGNNEIEDYIKNGNFSECKEDSYLFKQAEKAEKEEEEVNWKDLYKAIAIFTYNESTSAIIDKIDGKEEIVYTKTKPEPKTIKLSKTGFSKTISIVIAKNAMKKHTVGEKREQKQKISNIKNINDEILNIVNKKEQEYQKELIETFLIELRKYKKDSDIQTIKDVLTIVCKEISATNEDLVIELNNNSEKPKKEVYYYFYKQKLEELNEAKEKLEKTFKERDDFFGNQEENKELILNLDDKINDEIDKINNIREAFEEGCEKYHGSENSKDCKNFTEIYKEINKNIEEEREKVLKINGFTKLGVGFINGKTIEYKEKIEEFKGLDEIEKFKTKVEYCVLGAIAYIDNGKEKNIYSGNDEDDNLLTDLLKLIATKKEDGKWIQKKDITKEEIENKIKNWKPEVLENKPVFAALTYYNEKEPVVNFVSKGELRPAYSYNEFDGKKYMIFMIPEKGNDVVEPKYYVFDEKGELVSKPPFTITHDIVNCNKAIAYDGNEKMETIDTQINYQINGNQKNIVSDNNNNILSKLLKGKYITERKDGDSLNEYRTAVQDDALFINEIKEKNGKEIEEDKEYVESDPKKDGTESKKGSEILKRRGGMLGAGEGRSR